MEMNEWDCDYQIRPGVVLNLKEHIRGDWERRLLPSEQSLLNYIIFYSHYYTGPGVLPFRQRQSTIAAKMGVSRKTVNLAFRRLVKRGVLIVEHHARRCNTLMFGKRILKALWKVHKSLHHFGLVQHVEKSCIEYVRRKYRAMRQGDCGYAAAELKRKREAERKKYAEWQKERDESTGAGYKMFADAMEKLSKKIAEDERSMASARSFTRACLQGS